MATERSAKMPGRPGLAASATLAAAILAASSLPGVARAATPLRWTTLGTEGGPIIDAKRSQPANLLTVGAKPWIVDCGDGCVERLAGAGHTAEQIQIAFISHLHMDHIGGVQGLIGLRWMQGAKSVLTIYGPPGTGRMVAGILQSLQPTYHIGDGVGGTTPPEKLVKVVIIKAGADLMVDGVRVRTARNSHFDDPPGHPLNDGTESLSYRFDQGGYSVGYTGDTGPSRAVEQLESGVNLLVSEVIDVPSVLSTLKATHPGISKAATAALLKHFHTEHVSPEEAGQIAHAAHAGRLVFTHLSISGPTDAIAAKLVAGAHKTYFGPVQVAHDLDTF